MALTYGYSGKTQTVAATTAQTIVFSSSDFNPTGCVAFHVGFTGANNDVDALTRIRVKANGETIVDVDENFLQAFVDRFTPSNANMANARAALTIPLWVPNADRDKRELCGWPIGAECQIELTTDNSTSAGIAVLAFTRSTVRPVVYPTLIGTPLNIAASQTNATYSFTKRGQVQGIAINTVGLDRAKIVLDGQEVLLLPGANYLGAATGDLWRESQHYSNGENQTDPVWVEMGQGLRAPSGSSYVELSTGAGWAGVANELCVWTLNAQGM